MGLRYKCSHVKITMFQQKPNCGDVTMKILDSVTVHAGKCNQLISDNYGSVL